MPDAAVHAGGIHAHQHLVVSDLGPLDVIEAQHVAGLP